MTRMRNRLFLTAMGLTVTALASSALAVDLTSSIINPSFEHSEAAIGFVGGGNEGVVVDSSGFLLDGQDVYLRDGLPASGGGLEGWKTWASSENGGMARIWNPGPVDRSSAQNNQFYDTSFGGVAPDGVHVIGLRTQYYDYDGSSSILDSDGNRTFNPSDWGTSYAPDLNEYFWAQDDGATFTVPGDPKSGSTGGNRSFEAVAQRTSESFDPTALYVLTVEAARLADNGWNSGAVTPTGGNSSRFTNDAVPKWNGYFTELMAGGDEGFGTNGSTTGNNQSGWVYGQTADPNEPGYIGSIAMDDQVGSSLAADTWETSTVTYTPNPATQAAMDALAGLPVVVRLGIYEPGDHLETAGGAFDHVRLVKYVAGDAEKDHDVDTADLTICIQNFTGAGGTGKIWDTGDFNGDGDTDTADITAAIINFTGASAGTAGVPDLVYDPATGNVTIDADGADVISFSLQSGPFNAADFSELPAGLTDNIASQIGWTSFNLFSGLTGTANLGAILPAGLDQAGLEAALQTASYGLALAGGGGGGRLDLIIPEPASMVLMGLGAVALVRRRRAA